MINIVISMTESPVLHISRMFLENKVQIRIEYFLIIVNKCNFLFLFTKICSKIIKIKIYNYTEIRMEVLYE